MIEFTKILDINLEDIGDLIKAFNEKRKNQKRNIL